MKILVLSDSHGNLDYMRQAVEREKPDRIFHLGDVVRDAARLQRRYPQIPMDNVRGNCDGCDESAPEEKEVLCGGKRLWLIHGHAYHVKSGMGLGMAVSEARARGADVLCFGHTHKPLCTIEGGVWVLNPGTCKGFPNATCGVIEIEDGQVRCRTVDLKKPPEEQE